MAGMATITGGRHFTAACMRPASIPRSTAEVATARHAPIPARVTTVEADTLARS